MKQYLLRLAAFFVALLLCLPYPVLSEGQGLSSPAPGTGPDAVRNEDKDHAASGVSRCLILGYDHFVSLPDIAPCSAHNAAVMTALLTDFTQNPQSVIRRVNSPGTVSGLEHLIRYAFRESTRQDTCFLYLSTHGVSWEEEGRTRLALILSDGRKEEALSPEMLKAMLDPIPGQKVLIVDACHSGVLPDTFQGSEYRLLVSSAAEEDSYFWRTGAGEGSGYFTSALESALRFSDPDQIDRDQSGDISLPEVLLRLKELYGSSSAQAAPAGDAAPLFRLPENREPGERLRGLAFDAVTCTEDALILPLRFSVDESTRLEYRLAFLRNGTWDFENLSAIPDQERTGTTRGLLSPGDKERMIRLSRDRLGEEGKALLLVVSLRGLHGQVAVLEGTAVISEPRPAAGAE